MSKSNYCCDQCDCERKTTKSHKECQSRRCHRGHRGATGPTGPCCKGDTGSNGATGPAGINPAFELAGFFGMTLGPGNSGANDYVILINNVVGSGPSITNMSALNFPRPMHPAIGGIIIGNVGPSQTDNTDFILPSVGIYRIVWHVSVTEHVQWSLWISTDGSKAHVPYSGPGGLFSVLETALGSPSQIGQATGTSQLIGNVTFYNSVAGSAIQIRNNNSVGPVTITPLPGGTNAQAACLTIQRLA